MNLFNKRAAQRIAFVSVMLAAIVTPVAWLISTESAEGEVVSLAMEESRRILRYSEALELTGPAVQQKAAKAVTTLSGGIFDIAELYDRRGEKLSESHTDLGVEVESQLPEHIRPAYTASSYESLQIRDQWVLRVFIPLRAVEGGEVTGYFEGVRIVPDWQRNEIHTAAIKMALIACLASVLCGAAIYPIVVKLSADNTRKTIEVLDSHISMMERSGEPLPNVIPIPARITIASPGLQPALERKWGLPAAACKPSSRVAFYTMSERLRYLMPFSSNQDLSTTGKCP